VRIETERLVLRRWRADDIDPIAAILLDPAVARWLGDGPSREDVERAIERYERSWEARGFGRFAVEERATGALVGRVGIMRADAWTATPEKEELGWAIAPVRWGLGYASEAARASIHDGFARLGLRRILAFTLAENVASRRVMERCGMTERGTATWAGLPHVWYDVTPTGRRPPPET
jgi:RimJ/RimL family protein N-acetyltransferase